MNLEKYIKIKPRIWTYIPWLSGSANTIYPYIYLPAEIYTDLENDQPKINSLATLAHEETHLQRQKEVGITKYAFLYTLNKNFRFEEELIAIKEQMKILKNNFDIEERAKRLSSYEYLWCASFQKALERLKIIRTEINEKNF